MVPKLQIFLSEQDEVTASTPRKKLGGATTFPLEGTLVMAQNNI
jgi:hypothetical protein